MRLVSAFVTVMMALSASAQSGGHAEVFSGNNIAAKLASLLPEAKPSGSSGATLGDYKSHAIKLSVRTASGGAEVHAHFDDIFVVTDGEATLITGGTVVGLQNGADGESKGSRIQDGVQQAIHKDDIVHIPAGTPHQLIVAPGATFSTIVVKVKEE